MNNSQRDEILILIRRNFPEAAVSAVLEMLDCYGARADEPERIGVQIAIVKLSEGQISKIQYFVEAAKRDYRDLLH
jgi:hypothetical protein